jgi:hypothetical protein
VTTRSNPGRAPHRPHHRAGRRDAASVRFYTELLGSEADGQDGPFSAVRVNAYTLLLLAPWSTDDGYHYAFALSAREFDEGPTHSAASRAGMQRLVDKPAILKICAPVVNTTTKRH